MKALPRRKRMLLPLNIAGRPILKTSIRAKILGSLFRALGSFWNLCFGWLGWILDRSSERRLAAEVRRELYFLFEDHEARIVPSKRSRYATTIAIEFGNVRLQVSRHHDETAFSVASVFAPDESEPFQLIVSGITSWGSAAAPFATDLPTFAPILKKSIPFLQQSLSKDNWHSTLTRSIETENTGIDESAARARANGIEPIVYSSRVTKDF